MSIGQDDPEDQRPRSGAIRSAVRKLEELSDDRFEEVVKLVEAMTPIVGGVSTTADLRLYTDLAEHVAYIARINDEGVERVALDVALGSGGTAVAAERLSKLASCQVVWLGAKAAWLITSHERTLRSAHVFSDLRPVFSDEGERLVASVMVHSLMLTLTNDNSTFLSIAMDDRDLRALASTVARAIKKSEEMRKTFSTVPILPVLEV